MSVWNWSRLSFPFYLGKYEDFSLPGNKIYWNSVLRYEKYALIWQRFLKKILSFRPLPCGYPGNLCLIASVRGMHCANGPTVFLFKTKIIKHLKWANKWPRKPNVCFSFILSRINLCYCCRKPVPRSQSSSWTTDVFYGSSLIASGHLFVCAEGGKDTRVSNMIMWLFGVSAITTQLNTQSLTG